MQHHSIAGLPKMNVSWSLQIVRGTRGPRPKIKCDGDFILSFFPYDTIGVMNVPCAWIIPPSSCRGRSKMLARGHHEPSCGFYSPLTSICSSLALPSHCCLLASIRQSQMLVFHFCISFDDTKLCCHCIFSSPRQHQNSVNGLHKDCRVGCSNPGEYCQSERIPPEEEPTFAFIR